MVDQRTLNPSNEEDRLLEDEYQYIQFEEENDVDQYRNNANKTILGQKNNIILKHPDGSLTHGRKSKHSEDNSRSSEP